MPFDKLRDRRGLLRDREKIAGAGSPSCALRQAQGPEEVEQGPEEVTQGPEEVEQGPEEVASGPEEVAQGPGEGHRSGRSHACPSTGRRLGRTEDRMGDALG